MKIFLLQPFNHWLSPKVVQSFPHCLLFPPLGLAYLAAALIKNGHKVQILDRNVVAVKNKLNLMALDDLTMHEIINFSPDIIGFTATTPLMKDVKYFSDIVKKVMPDKKLILGGAHPTVEAEESLTICKAIDVIVRGEGERTIINLVDNLDKLSEIKGISFRENENVISNENAKQITDLDVIPMPSRYLLDMDFYCQPMFSRGLYGRFATNFTSRGCYGRCNYCAGYKVFTGCVRYHSPERVLAETEELISKHKIDYLYFLEDELLSDAKRVEKICELFKKKNINKKIKWIAQMRPEVNRVNKDLIRLIKSAGCVQLEVGFESGSQEELDRMNKRTKEEEYYHIIKLLNDAKMRFQANIILNYPCQSMEDLTKTICFIKKSGASVIQLNPFTAHPGSQAYEKIKNELIDRDEYYAIPDISLSKNLTAIPDREYRGIVNTVLNTFKCRMNRKHFMLFHLINKPLFFFDFYGRRVLERILKALITIIKKKYFPPDSLY